MKKTIRMGVKPLAMATAFAAGTSVSMIAVALPGGDTLGASGTVGESICQRSVNMTIAGNARSVTTGAGTCQLRSLPPTKGLVLAESSPAGGTVSDSSALVNAGGELYEAYVGGNRQAAVVLTPNRALSASRSIAFQPGNNGSVSFDLAAAVQPSTGLQSSWLTGTYTVITRNHGFGKTASDLESSVYAAPNYALGEQNYTHALRVTFDGAGGCTFTKDTHTAAQLTKDPLFAAFGEMDNGCTTGGGLCGQNAGNNYVAIGTINTGSTTVDNDGNVSGEADWMDASGDPDGKGARMRSCSYTTAPGKVTVNYATEFGDLSLPLADPGLDAANWTVTYDISSDLRYLVSDGDSLTDFQVGGAGVARKGGLSVGVRTSGGAVLPALTGKTFLFNALDGNYAASTPTTPSYENPATPVYQEEECISRGSLSLAAAGKCTFNVVNTCSGRYRSGYEETADGAGDGTISDLLTVFDGSPAQAPTCAWAGNAAHLAVDIGVINQEGNYVAMQYTGSASDNGEAIALHGIYTTTGLVPDVDNKPLLPQQKFNMESFLVGMEYQGSLTADADADGLNNLGEFQWAQNNGPLQSVSNDYNNDAVSDVLMVKVATGENFVFPFANGAATSYAKGGLYPNTSWSVAITEDFDHDGDTDVVMRGPSEWHIFNMVNGAATPGTKLNMFHGTWQFNSTGDFNGDGTKDILERDVTTGQFWRFTMGGLAVTANAKMALYGAPWEVAVNADFDGDGDDDVLMHNTSTKQWRIFTVQNGAVTGDANMALFGATWEFAAVGDFDGDDDQDVLLRNSATGEWQTFLVQNNAVASSVKTGLFPSTDWQFVVASDLNSDGITDVLMQKTTTGEWWRGVMAGGVAFSSAKFRMYASDDWTVINSNDYSGDGTGDMLIFKDLTDEYFTATVKGGDVVSHQKSKIFPVDRTVYQVKD